MLKLLLVVLFLTGAVLVYRRKVEKAKALKRVGEQLDKLNHTVENLNVQKTTEKALSSVKVLSVPHEKKSSKKKVVKRSRKQTKKVRV